MSSLIYFVTINHLSLFLVLLQGSRVSFGIYEIKKGLTPFGWAIIVILPIALILGAIYLAVKVLKKPRLK
jgi:hypothetical protein